jgi:type II secretory pathway predicted ATPase ExeA
VLYEDFYKLREAPFTLTPDPAFLYRSRQHSFAYTLLRYGIVSRASFCLLSGEVGSGKTLLVRQLLSSLDQDICVGILENTSRQMGRLLPWVCLAFGLSHEGKDDPSLYRTFVEFVARERSAGRNVVLIVDEAQNLGPDMLEELRVLSNINIGKDAALQIFLVGQPELRDMLRMPQLRQFAQRISIDFHLEPLSLSEAHAYVRHRLAIAGGSPDLISAGAVDLLHASTAGVPRLINQLCDTALVYGFSDQRPSIDADLMAQVIADRSAGGVFPVAGKPVAGNSVGLAPVAAAAVPAM